MIYITLRNVANLSTERLKARATALEPGPLIDPRARFIYGLAVAMLVAASLATYALGLTFSGTRLGQVYLSLLWLLVAALVSRRYGFARVATLFEASLLPPLLGGLAVATTFISAWISLPFADHALVRLDAAVGFDWRRAFALYQDRPWLLELSTQAYRSFFKQLLILPVILILTGHATRFWTFLTAWALSSLITATVFAVAPAVGPYLYFGVTPDDIPGFYREYPWQTAGIIAGIKSGELNDITQAMGGLVSFPSFHAVAAVLFTWAGWGVRPIRYPVLALNVAMWLSTLVIGAHYLIDLIAGTALAFAMIAVSRQIVSRLAKQGTRTNDGSVSQPLT